MLRIAAAWMLLGALYLALFSWCVFCARQPPDTSALQHGLMLGGTVTLVASWWSRLRTLVALTAGAAAVASMAVVMLGLAAELGATASDPYGAALGTYFPDHGWWLAWAALLAVVVPACTAWMAAAPTLRALSPARWLVGLWVIGIAVGSVIANVPGTTPLPSESVRIVRSNHLLYEAVLPPNYGRLESWGLFLGEQWHLPEAIDWFEPEVLGPAAIQLSVWSTPLAPGTSHELFVAAQIAADRTMQLRGPLERERATVGATGGTLLTYRAQPAPLLTGTGHWIFGSGTVTDVWSDCRFRLAEGLASVHVARIVAVVGDVGYVVSVYSDPRRRAAADRAHRIFTASLRSLDRSPDRTTNVQRSYPRSEPMRKTSDRCMSV